MSDEKIPMRQDAIDVLEVLVKDFDGRPITVGEYKARMRQAFPEYGSVDVFTETSLKMWEKKHDIQLGGDGSYDDRRIEILRMPQKQRKGVIHDRTTTNPHEEKEKKRLNPTLVYIMLKVEEGPIALSGFAERVFRRVGVNPDHYELKSILDGWEGRVEGSRQFKRVGGMDEEPVYRWMTLAATQTVTKPKDSIYATLRKKRSEGV